MDAVRVLLQFGADPLMPDGARQTCVAVARQRGNADVLAELGRYTGADSTPAQPAGGGGLSGLPTPPSTWPYTKPCLGFSVGGRRGCMHPLTSDLSRRYAL